MELKTKVVRGGHTLDNPKNGDLKCADRYNDSPNKKSPVIGFRTVRTATGGSKE